MPERSDDSRAALIRLSGEFGLVRRLLLSLFRQSPRTQGIFAGGVFLVIAVAWSLAYYQTVRGAFRDSVDSNLLTIARLAARQVDPEVHARFTRPDQQESPEYLAQLDPLREIVAESRDVHSIYTMRPSPEGFRFVLDTGSPEDLDGDGVPDQATLGSIYLQAPAGLLQAIQTQDSYISPEPYTDLWGTFLTAWVPIRSHGRLEAVLGVDMDLEQYFAKSATMRRAQIMDLLVASAASLLIGLWVALNARTKREFVDRIARSEYRHALVVHAANEGIWDWDLREDTVYQSERHVQMVGDLNGPDERGPILDRFLARVHPDDRQRVLDEHEANVRDRSPFHFEIRIRSGPTAAYRWYQVHGHAIRDDRGQPVRLVGSLGDVHDRVRLGRQLRRAARADRLTHLLNRPALLRQTRRAIREHRRDEGSHFALLFLDFDRFKVVNDSLGHDVGDDLLIAIASRLRENIRGRDNLLQAPDASGTAARIGGDEFVILLQGLRRPGDALAVAERLLKVLAEPYLIGPYRVLSTASIGVVLGDDRYESAEDLLRDADTAMYEAKASCRGTLALFDETMRSRMRRRMQIEQGLRDAVANRQFDLAYQPIVCLKTGRILCFEVLTRWAHPELGPVSPDEFIPLAEECGLIAALSEQTIERSFAQLARWRDENPLLPTPGLSINLARQHLLLYDLVPRLLRMTEQAGLSPSNIHLEITEGTVMHDVSLTLRTLEELRAAGFLLAIDDFGTGYSSLSCLHQFQFDLLKLDRSFTQGLGFSASQTAIVRAITSLADILGFRVVAEGIETAEQLALLRSLGCDFGQGYHFARPAPADQLLDLDRITPGQLQLDHATPC